MKRRPRTLIGECIQEISSFNLLPGGYSNFPLQRGVEMFAQDGINTSIGGALAVYRESGMEPVLAISACDGSAGILRAQAWQRLAKEVLHAIAAQGGNSIDGVYFSLHGAMAAQGELDPEGYLLAETRRHPACRLQS